MDEARGLVARDPAQFLDERDDRVTDAAGALGDIVEPQVLGSSGATDRVGDRRRNQTQPGFGAGQSRFNVEHELQVSNVREQRAGFVSAVERAENLRVGGMNAHTSKNTVSCSPCSTMSKRSTPGRSIRAIKVERRAGAMAFSTVSPAFSGSSGK